jgi:hypothetical protein
MQLPPGKIRRLMFIVSGVTDTLIGGVLLVLALQVIPNDLFSRDPLDWVFISVGAIMFVTGLAVAFYNFSRFEE